LGGSDAARFFLEQLANSNWQLAKPAAMPTNDSAAIRARLSDTQKYEIFTH
jgi:hypothetical protein